MDDPTMRSAFWNAFGSGVGGFVGVFCFFVVRGILSVLRARPKTIVVYPAAGTGNQGQGDEQEGETMHHFGKRIHNPQNLGVTHPIWQWTRDPAGSNRIGEGGKPTGDSIFYGPYATDCCEPGNYVAVFRVRAEGLRPPNDVRADHNVLSLDVFQRIKNAEGTGWSHKQRGKIRVRLSQLNKSGWQQFRVQFYSDGDGTWEYRAFAFDGIGESADNLKAFPEAAIYFDTIRIQKLSKFELLPG